MGVFIVRIGISGTFWAEPMVGSGQYLRHLIEHLPHVGPQHEYVLFLPAYTHAEIPQIPHIAVDLVPTPFDKLHPKLAKIWYEQIELPRAALRLAVDMLHVPYYAPPRRQLVPTVVTVHDLIPLILPVYRGSMVMRAYTALATSAVRRCRQLVAVSDHTRDDIIDILKVNALQVHTIYEGVAPDYQPQSEAQISQTLQRFNITQPYFYYIGGFDVRKNLTTLLRAFGRVRRRIEQPIKLVIAGNRPKVNSAFFPALETTILDEDLAADIIFTGRVSNAENAALFAGASAFVWPSTYEGFGLPPLEAMSCGTPVISSNTSSMPEIVGEAGILLPPHDTEAWAMAMLRMLNDQALNTEYRQRGLQRASQFNWHSFAAQMIKVYEKA